MLYLLRQRARQASADWAAAWMQGWRSSMEDAHCAPRGAAATRVFGVFDGHGGDQARPRAV